MSRSARIGASLEVDPGDAAPAPATYDVAALRAAEFPWAGETVYLDHASIGPLPERTRRTIGVMADKRARPFDIKAADQFGGLARARSLAGRLINADPGEIALATNTTFGLALAAGALPWKAGDIVLVSEREFPANVYPWKRLEARGVHLELVPTTAEGWPDEARLLERLEDPRVRCLALSLTQFASGYTADVARFSAVTRQRGQFLVLDAIQGLGQLPFDVRKTPVDILSSGAQKWLLSPWGSGFLYVRKELIETLEPTMVSWMSFEGTDDFTTLCHYRDELRHDARRFELITLPFQDFVAMNESLDLLLQLGIPAIQRHLATLQDRLVGWARDRGVPVASPTDRHRSGITCLAPPDIANVHRALRDAKIFCSLREGAIRISPHCYNTLEDIERVIEVLESK
ncbi:MAG TPA: aminotransferase class V-fold PLP-dependent enzyme [Gemmatimonadales bacterium]|nr:aminotransferase class V-fold PLP-dependent enzyme [Gemmatimonadales bacterium]